MQTCIFIQPSAASVKQLPSLLRNILNIKYFCQQETILPFFYLYIYIYLSVSLSICVYLSFDWIIMQSAAN